MGRKINYALMAKESGFKGQRSRLEGEVELTDHLVPSFIVSSILLSIIGGQQSTMLAKDVDIIFKYCVKWCQNV